MPEETISHQGRISDRTFSEQVSLLYTKSPVRPLLHLIPGTIICMLVAGFVSTIVLLLWFGTLVFINTIRFSHILHVCNTLHPDSPFRLPRNYFAASTALVGLFQSRISQLAIPHESSKISNHITLSTGISCSTMNLEKPVRKLIHDADNALYNAKNTGRNMIKLEPDVATI